MKIINSWFLFAMLLCVFSFAEGEQTKLWDYSVKIGLNLGGTMPVPLPANIIKIKSYSPYFVPTIEATAARRLDEKIAVSAGLRLDNKGMKSTAEVKEYQMNIGNLRGKFNGIVDTEMSANYIGLPVLAHYAFTNIFSVYAGGYYAYMLNGEFKGTAVKGYMNYEGNKPMENEHYNFSNHLRNHDAGLIIGLNLMPFAKRILFSFDFNYGLLSVFPDNFNDVAYDMQNVYGKFSAGYLF